MARLFGFLSVVKPKKVKLALSDISLDLYQNDIIGLIGASGSGKSTLLKCINRLHESLDKPPIFKGNISIDGEDINHPDLDIVALRSKVGMVFQKPNPFPKTIRDNVLYGARIHGLIPPGEEDAYLEKYLRKAALWDEVKDRLDDELGTDLSGGQQQRLCIARAIASQPEILLMDEPTSALDPKSTVKIEQLMLELKKEMTIVLVTHSLGQAKRVTDYLVFLEEGRVIEHGLSDDLFNSPQTSELREYYAYEAGSDISATGTGPEKPHA
ncbi:MAG: phosphate ABC transporter ATP-binding protein [Pseudomonadota bacterium]